jgi:DNA end-binding protein Ku
VQLESNHTIDIEQFVSRSEVDQLYLDTPYYLTPTDRVGEEAFAVIRDAMRAEKMVGLARVVLFRRERIVMLEPRGKGIAVTTLHYANEVHQAANYFDEIPDLDLPKQMLELATHIIDKMTGKFAPEKFEDRYENALIELIRSKQAGMPVRAQPAARPTNVINLMDALRRSVEGAGAKGGAERAPDKKAEKAPARKAEKTDKAAPKARATSAKARARKAG